MKLESYESLREQNAYEALWLELLNASGFAGVLSDGKIVDRRYHPEAVPVQENSVFGVAKTKIRNHWVSVELEQSPTYQRSTM